MTHNYWRQQKQRVIYQLREISEGKDYSAEIDKIDASSRRTMKIKNFYGNKSEEVKYEKDFEVNCIVLAQHVNQPVKTLTVKEYFNLLKYVKDKK